MYSVIIRNGLIYDGTGGLPQKADIALQDDEIVYIGKELLAEARLVIDAAGLAVAPGFIDLHSHTDWTIFSTPMAESKLLQGVTTEVICNCGIGVFPVNNCREEELKKFLSIHGVALPKGEINWRNFSEYAQTLNQIGLGLNLTPLVGHSALRIAAMGSENRDPSANELDEMKALLAECLNQGAWGLSAGLVYPPSCYGKTEELIELAGVIAALDAIFTFHLRSESGLLLQSIDEVIRIGEISCARVQVSHLKAIGKPYWGSGKLALDKISDAQGRGVNIGTDQYPYDATSTTLTVIIPAWVHDGGVSEMLKKLADSQLRERLEQEISSEVCLRGGPEKIVVASVGSKRNAGLCGQSIADIAKFWRCGAEEAIIRLLLEESAAVGALYFSLSPDDLQYILSSPLVSVASDGQAMSAETDAGKGVHPRSYGTYPRILGKYVREKKSIPLETAIYKMTSLPASRLNLMDRGVLRPGARADIVLFDPATVIDNADYLKPHQYPTGIQYVFVNGQVAVENSKITGKAAGRVLVKPRRSPQTID